MSQELAPRLPMSERPRDADHLEEIGNPAAVPATTRIVLPRPRLTTNRIEESSMRKRSSARELARASLRMRLETLEDRLAPTVTASSSAVNWLPTGPPGLTGNQWANQSPHGYENGSGASFAPGEILVGFTGSVVQSFHARGATAALQEAGRIVGPHGLGNPEVLFDVPAAAGRSARLVTRWHVPANSDVSATSAAVARQAGVAYA